MQRARSSSAQFIITIDTETYKIGNKPPAFGDNIYAELPQGSFGVSRIMDICDKHGVKATFFTDVYMHHHYGKPLVAELCRGIDQRGHDVQLHAHPAWLPGSHSQSLHAYSLGRQIEILQEGKDFIEEATGKTPTAFRAGAYTANLDTITALAETGFLIDSSYFARHRNCILSEQLGNEGTNRPFQIGSILEIPVTTYWMLNRFGYRKLSKLDINACSNAEMKEVIPQLVSKAVPYVILFLHSFSFVKWKRDLSGVVPNYRALERFDALLESIVSADSYAPRFSTMAEIAEDKSRQHTSGSDYIPSLTPARIPGRALQRLLG